MKLFFTLLISFIFIIPADKDKTIKSDIFTIKYSQKFEQPLSVKYTVLCTDSKYSRKGLDFYKCDSIKTSDNLDYENNEYDKGHMAPAADFACDSIKLIHTFSYLNCALQHKDLNRGVWKNLEDHERELAKKHTTEITVTIHFSKKSVKLSTGATVPDGFTKEIRCGSIIEKYYFPNIKPVHLKYSQYQL
jgi:endonuclease G, mitochondrial